MLLVKRTIQFFIHLLKRIRYHVYVLTVKQVKQILKHRRSKHCDVCDRCVINFDHHCYYINNCIGKRNVKFFFFFLLIAASFVCYQVYSHFLIVIGVYVYDTSLDLFYNIFLIDIVQNIVFRVISILYFCYSLLLASMIVLVKKNLVFHHL